MNFEEQLKENVARVKTAVRKYLPAEEGFQKTLLEAMNYSMLAGGKRLRPLLMMKTYEMFGGRSQGDRAFYGRNGDDSYPLADP